MLDVVDALVVEPVTVDDVVPAPPVPDGPSSHEASARTPAEQTKTVLRQAIRPFEPAGDARVNATQRQIPQRGSKPSPWMPEYATGGTRPSQGSFAGVRKSSL